MNFDEIIDRQGTHSSKWDKMEPIYGVPANTGIAMWVADMDFRPPAVVQDALQSMLDHGIYGYFGDDREYLNAIQWWMDNRHGWKIDPEWVFTTHGLVNGTAMCVDAFTNPGDGVVLFTPVYHAFARIITASGRKVVECEMVNNNGRYELDFEAYDAQMNGDESMVWTKAELEQVAAFAKRHDLVLVSDEIHHDLTMPGCHHTPMALIDGIEDRLVMMTATTKTFNIAGCHSGNVIIADQKLRSIFAQRMAAMGLSPNSFGLVMATAAYSQQGAAWVDELVIYLDGNRKMFDATINTIPGLESMPLESTYLAWVDFKNTGMKQSEVTSRIEKTAEIAANHGASFGKGGESFMRFNIATPRTRVEEACARLRDAFKDLQ